MFSANRNLKDLIPKMEQRVREWLLDCKEAGLSILITETKRSKPRQLFLWSKGRVLPKKTEIDYLGYDDPRIDSRTGEKKVTWTLNSNHLKGEAIDFVFLKDGRAYWNAPDSMWQRAYDLAENVGLESLFRKSGYDRPHINLDRNWKPKKKTAYEKEIEEAIELVIKNKISNGERPDDSVSRKELYVILKRLNLI